MQDRPDPLALLASVAAFLRDEVVPQTGGALAFHARVAANALDLAAREIGRPAATDAAERQRLRALTGGDGSIETLSRALTDMIATGAIDAGDPALVDHLWTTTCDKLAVDQPHYASFRRTFEQPAAETER